MASDRVVSVSVLAQRLSLGAAARRQLGIRYKYSGKQLSFQYQGQNIKVSSDTADIDTEIDGDPGPPLPVQIKVIPQAVKVMVPEGAKPAGIRTRIIRAIG